MKPFLLSYDYRCPFAKIVHLHVIEALRAGADFDVTFVPWTMSQGYRDEGSLDEWDDPKSDSQLLSLAVSTSVQTLMSEKFLDVHEALFRARHDRAIRLVTESEIATALEGLDLDLTALFDDVASRRPHKIIGEWFREFERYDTFGVPTFVVDGDATFVRYMNPPTDDAQASIALIESLVTLMSDQSALNEFKHTKVAM